MDNKMRRQNPILVNPVVTMQKGRGYLGVILEILLLYAGLLGYILCNTTALNMGIPLVSVILITAVAFALMIALAWYKRVFFGVLGGVAALSLVAFPVTFKLYAALGRALAVCYNYTIYLLGSQENYSNYLNYMTMDLKNILENPAVLQRYFYTAVILLSLIAAMLFALALFKRIPIIVSFIAPIIGLVPFFYFGIVPHYIAFSIFLSALIGCYGQSVVQSMSRRRNSRVKKGTNIRQKREEKGKKRKGKRPPLTADRRLEFAATNGSFGVIIAGVMLVVTIGTAAIIYTRPIIQMDSVREKIDNIAVESMNTIFRNTYEKRLHVAGYMEDGEMLSLMMPSWRKLQVCTVSAKTDTPIYLRYRTTVDFTEEGWSMPDDAYLEDFEENVGYDFCEYTQFYKYLSLTAPDGDPLSAGLDNVDSEEQGYITDQITVYPKYKVSNLLGLPSGATSQAPLSDFEDLEREGDTILRHNDNPKDKSYMFRVVSPVLTSKIYLTNFETALNGYLKIRSQHGDSDPYMSQEQNYSRFVYRHYTNIPDQLKGIIGNLAKEITAPYKTKLEKVQAIERYFRENYQYSAVRQRLVREDGSEGDAYDYIEYFLHQNENKEGYCTLFATSMVALLRDLGYPARVATGYYAQPYLIDLENYATALSDNNFHSWVEVYFEGMGWMTFEPTPDFGVERNYYLLELVDEQKEPEFQPSIEVVYEEIPGFVKYSKELPDPTEEEEKNDISNMIASALKIDSMNDLAKNILRVILVILLLLGILLAGEIWRRRSVKAVQKGPPSESTRRAYYLILRLMQLQGFKFFEGELLEDFARRADNLQLAPIALAPIVPILEKSLYSPIEITEEERDAVATYLRALDKAVFKRANPFRAFWYTLTLQKKPRHKALIWHFS